MQEVSLWVLVIFFFSISGIKTSMPQNDLVILHFNDVYNLEPQKEEPVGGAARFVSCVKSYQSLNPLVLFSGDVLNPSLCKYFKIWGKWYIKSKASKFWVFLGGGGMWGFYTCFTIVSQCDDVFISVMYLCLKNWVIRISKEFIYKS